MQDEEQAPDLTRRLTAIATEDNFPSEAEVESEVACVLESPEFRKSKRSQQFLQHIVECTLKGDVERLKESVIGLDLFGRVPGYNTGGDATVRVRAYDVRRRLLAYYQRVGASARVRIELPPGAYMPRFGRNPAVVAAPPQGADARQQLAARPFLPLEDTRLRQLHGLAARLNADARGECPASAGGVRSQAESTSNHCWPALGDEPVVSERDLLHFLIARLAETAQADCVYIGAVVGEAANTVKAIAVVKAGQRAESFEYPLAGAPCENVIGQAAVIYARGVQREFPNDALLREMDAESYAGIPLSDCRGESLGLLVAVSRQPLRDAQLAKSLLEVYAGRIAAELERQIAGHALHESELRYRTLFEAAGDAFLLLTRDRFVDCNPKALQLFKCTREQLLSRRSLTLAPPRQPDGSDSGAAVREKFEQALRGKAVSFDWLAQGLDGSTFDAEITLSRVDNFGAAHCLALVRDVTQSRESERRIRQSEERFRAVFEGAGIGMAVLNSQGRIIESNPAWQALLGYSETELAGLTFADYTHPGDVDSDMRLFTELLQGKRERYQMEKRYIRKDGQVFWGKLTASLVRSPNGEPQYCIKMAESIDDRKRAEAASSASEERFSVFFECAPEGYYVHDVNGVILNVNQAAERLSGYRRDELIGKTFAQVGLLPPDDLARALRLLPRSAHGEPVDSEEFKLIRKDGEIVDVEIRTFPIEMAEGKVIMGAVRDITQRKRAEKALRESEESSRAIIETAPDGIYIVADSGQIIEVNEAACRQLGYTREHLLQSRLSDIVAPRLAEQTARHIQQKAVGIFETAHLRADGSEVPLELRTCQLVFRGQAARLGVARDTTERKRAEQERASLQEQFQQAQKLESIGRLAGGVAHDFNNLLTVINGYSDLVLNQLREEDPLRARVEQIRTAGERAASLTKQLLAFSRKQVTRPRVLDLNTTIKDGAPILQRLIGEDIALTTHLDSCLGQVIADPDQIGQIIMNLAVNARDAMPNGGRLDIETTNVEFGEGSSATGLHAMPGRYVLLSVTDTGSGMDETIRQHIFEPFFTTKGAGEGTGLGLSTVYGIVRQSGGWIDVRSEVGVGTALRVYLPLVTSRPRPEMKETSVPTAGGVETILIVEDQETLRSLAEVVLKQYGYHVIEASDGEEAIAAASQLPGQIHLLLTDVILPGMNGKEVAERLKRLRPDVKVLFMSGYTADVIAHRGVLDRNVAFLRKPFSPEELAAKVRDVLSHSPESTT
jgi:PAS domain S-box-containing protein